MTTSKVNSKIQKFKRNDDSVFSKNNGNRIKYRLRVQEDKETEKELKDYEHSITKIKRVP